MTKEMVGRQDVIENIDAEINQFLDLLPTNE